MKNYYDLFNYSPQDKIQNSALTLFQKMIDREGESYTLDSTPTTLIVREHTNPLNEFKEERVVIAPLTTPIHRGSIITDPRTGENYLVVSDVDNNGVYKKSKMLKCNYTLKWQDSQANIHSYPVIASDLSLYTDGTQDTKQMKVVDTKISIQIKNDDVTKLIVRDQRFIVSRQVYQVTRVEDVTKPGLLVVTMSEVKNNDKDNFETGIADNSHLYIPKPPITDVTIIGSDTLKLGQLQSYEVNDTTNSYMWFVTNGDTSITSQANNKCTIKGNALGTVTLRAICVAINKTIEKSITVTALY